MIVKLTKYINIVTFGIVFSFCFILDIIVCLLNDLMFSNNEISDISIIWSLFIALIIALVLHLFGRFRIYEIDNYHQDISVKDGNKMINFGNTKLIYKNIISALGYQKAFIYMSDGKMYFIGNKFYAYKMYN